MDYDVPIVFNPASRIPHAFEALGRGPLALGACCVVLFSAASDESILFVIFKKAMRVLSLYFGILMYL